MTELSAIYAYLPWALALLAVMIFVILYQDISYPHGDGIALLAMASSLTSANRIDQFFTICFPNNPTFYSFERNKLFYTYNLFLNCLRLLPVSGRFRAAQLMNICLFLLLLGLFFAFLLLFAGDIPHAVAYSLIFTLLLAVNIRLVITAMIVCTDTLGFVLFMLSALAAMAVAVSPSIPMALILGMIVGISFRNRQADIIRIIAAMLTLTVIGSPLSSIIACLAGFVLSIMDLLYFQFIKGERALDSILGFMEHNLPTSKTRSSRMGHLVAIFFDGIGQMLNWKSKKSLWHSAGIPLALLPVSIIYLAVSDQFSASLMYPLLCYLGYTAAFLFIRRETDTDTGYFGNRQAYILFIPLHLFNAAAFMALNASGHDLSGYVYLAVYMGYVFRQAMKIWRIKHSDKIDLIGLVSHTKKPKPSTVTLRKWIESRNEPTVLMGSHPAWGEVHDFYNWTSDMRAVNLAIKLDDASLMDIADHYGVTHIAVTPISWFPIPGTTTIRSAKLGPLLRDRLVKHEISEDVTIFEVVNSTSGHSKESL